mgnify:FL=1
MTYKVFLQNILSAIWALSALSVLCTVFTVSSDLWNGTVTGKYFWFFLSQTVFAGFTLLNVLLRKKKWSVSILDVLVLVFIAYCSANHLARDSGFEIKLYLLLSLGMFYVCLRVFIQTLNAAVWLLPAVIILAGFSESVTGLMQLYGFLHSNHSLYKITGHFFNPGPFSGFVALTVPLAAYYVVYYWNTSIIRINAIRATCLKNIHWTDKLKQVVRNAENIPLSMVVLSVLNLTGALLVIPAAMSRSAWFAITAGVLVVLVSRYGLSYRATAFFRRNKKRSVLMSIAAIIIAAAAFTGVYNLKRGSADGRLFLWKVASGAIAEKPVFGYGLGNFAGTYGQAQYGYFILGVDEKEAMTADSPAYAFNEFIQIGVEQGIVGLLLFLGIIIIAVASCIRSQGKAGVLGAIVAVLVFGFTSYPLSVLPICIAFVTLLPLSNGENNSFVLPKVVFVAISIILAGSCIYFTARIKPLRQAYRSLRVLTMTAQYNQYDYSKDFQELISYLNKNYKFMFSYGKALAAQNKFDESSGVLIKGASSSSDPMFYNLIGNNYLALGETEKVEKYYWKAYYTLPNRLYPLYLLTKLYHETGQDEKAKEIAMRLLEKEPKVMSTAVREMKDYAQKIMSE